MAALYLSLMVMCLFFGLKDQQDYASKECQRRSNDCQTRELATRLK
jgi:hypothetical protein